MEKMSIVSNNTENKKIFIRKEIEASRLGKSVYEDDVLSQYTVYLVRKFEQGVDYDFLEQFELLLALLPEEFNTYFEDFVLKKMYIRSTSKAVYISLFLALANPLVKLQMNELRKWVSDLVVPEMPLEHTSNFIDHGNPIDVSRSLQETNSEVLLLTEMMNQFGQNLTEIFDEVKQLKEKKVPPVVKVVPSEVLVKQSIETENSQKITEITQQIEQLTTDFFNFKEEMVGKISVVSKPRKPPKFKVVLGTGMEGKLTLESRLTVATEKINSLTKEIQETNEKMAFLDNKVLEVKNTKTPKVTFSKATKTSSEKTQLETKLATTTQEVSSLSQQIQQLNEKLNTVETNVLEKKPDSEIVERIEKDRGKIQQNASDTIRLTQIIEQLNNKLQTVESQLVTVKEEKMSARGVEEAEKRSKGSVEDLTEQHEKDKELLKVNATEIKKLTQTVGKVDVQLIQAHQKIAELEQKMRSAAKYEQQLKEAVAQQARMSVAQGPRDVPRQQTIPTQSESPVAVSPSKVPVEGMERARNFPSKEAFLQSIKQTGNNNSENSAVAENQSQQGVTLAIEKALDRVSEKHPNPESMDHKIYNPTETANQKRTSNLRQLKKIEWDIHALFQKNTNAGHRGMVSKETFRTYLKKMDVLPYLWGSVYKKEQQDILLGNDLSCQKLIDELDDFLEEMKDFGQKRKLMGKWVYCPKEVEQKMEGYKLLNDYLELYLER